MRASQVQLLILGFNEGLNCDKSAKNRAGGFLLLRRHQSFICVKDCDITKSPQRAANLLTMYFLLICRKQQVLYRPAVDAC